MKNASIRQRLLALANYSWSSYRIYTGQEKPRWPVKTGEILSDFGSSLEKQQRKYARYVVMLKKAC